MKATISVYALLLLSGLSAVAAAQEPVGDIENACVEQGGQGDPCATSADCAANAYATVCVELRRGDPASRACQIPCEAGEGIDFSAQPAACALGESCVEGKVAPGRVGYYCQPARFRMDLNLLDSCVRHWLEGSAPSSFGQDNVCALEGNLNRLLDQDGDRAFDIFDLDLCVLSFLEQPGCDPQEGSCDADDLTLCAQDEDCGDGLYCDLARNACTRDCGYISSRELSTQVLDRQCAGAFKTCDYSRGRCQAVPVEDISCQVDRDCLSGSYCLLGQCAPECSRSIDCPDNRWYCTTNNQCRVLPPPEANDGFVFDPRNYTIRFARNTLDLDAVEDSASSPIAIIDLQTRRQVLSMPSVSFGYRLEVTYGLKEDAACLRPFVDCADADQREGESEEACSYRQADCLIDDTEEWVRLLSPFGVVTAAGTPSLQLELDEEAAGRLSPGRYTAAVRAIYDNGDSDTIQVTYNKPTISGEYEGTLTVALGGPENALNREQPINFGMKIRVLDQVVRWNEVLEAQGLEQERDFLDITQGNLVHASLHGNTSFAFTRSGVRRYADNEIPFVGLYSPQLGRMRLLGFIDVEEDFCVGLNGACEDGRDLHARNLLGRKIRRQIEFIGPYEEAGQRFHGVYREKVSGLAASYDVTLDGGFRLDQAVADDSGLDELPALLEDAETVSFPALEEVNALLEGELEATCDARSRQIFQSRASFRSYLAQATRAGDSQADRAVYPTQIRFSAALSTALGLLRGQSGGGDVELYDDAVLSLHDFLAGRVLPCAGDEDPSEAGCVDEAQTRCGLLLYQKALINGWADRDAVETDPMAGRLPLLCADTLQPEGCLTGGAEAPDVFAYQEHNLFWFNLAQILKFDGDHALSDAFLTLYRNQVNPFQRGAAVDYKRGKLLDAIARYDEATQVMLSPQSAAVMHDWPILSYLQSGNNWLATMQSVLSDRLSAVAELADLSRRVFNTTSEDDFLVAQHLMQHEYLYQVYLISLQRDWQGPSFAYEGAAASVFEQGQRVLTQYNPARNGLGVIDGRVYLENDDPTRSNWQHYRDLLVGEGGMIPAAREEIGAAVSNLQGAVRDLDALEDRLFLSHADLQHEFDVYCGPPDDVANLCMRADLLRAQEDTEWERQFDCIFGANIGERQSNCSDISERFVCSDFKFDTRPTDSLYDVQRADTDNCKNVLKEVNSASLIQYADNLTCPFNDGTKNFYVSVRGQQRACVGGEAGALLGERARLNQERFDILGSIGTMLKKLNADVQSKQVVLDDAYRDFNFRIIRATIETGIKTILNAAETIQNSTSEALEGPDCIFVIGFSNGTDCPQKAVVKTVKATKEIVYGVLKNIGEGLLEVEMLLREIGLEKTAFYRDIVELEAEFSKAERDIDDLTGQFRLLTTEIYNLDLQLANIDYQVAAASDGYAEEATFLFDRLVGRESGSTLFGRQLVIGSSVRFREAHQYTYRMLRAFIHQYNLPTGDATVLTNRLLAAVTLDDLEGLIAELDRREREYCGQEGLDCDAFSNTEVLRVSLRDTLFPQLRDVVDPNTGRVVTAGEQFHNIITSPPWVRRRLFGAYTVDQIELPFSLPLNLQESGPDGPRWLINPLTCGQFLATRAGVDTNHPGNVAVNIKGRNLDEGERQLRYELVRGDTDLVRGCQLESVTEEVGQLPTLQYPIRRHIVGYAPQSPLAQQEAQPTFVTRSGPLSSCLNQPERGGDLRDSPGCWRYFARGRSLSSLDWRLSIPLQIDNAATENAWVSGEGLPEDQRPIIDDVVLYFRYSARPIGE